MNVKLSLCQVSAFELGLGFNLTYVMTPGAVSRVAGANMLDRCPDTSGRWLPVS